MSSTYDRRFDKAGTGVNAKPHRLIPHLDADRYGGVRWELECPYEGESIPCGILVKCVEHLYPVPPSNVPIRPGEPVPPHVEAAWEEWDAAVRDWRDNHGPGDTHPGPKCWYAYMINETWDAEPEYYLQPMEAKPIVGPLLVLVGVDDPHPEDASPLLKNWPEEAL